MKEFIFDYQEGILKGLRPFSSNSMDNKSLTRSDGMFPYATKVLTTHYDVQAIDLSFLNCSFPYPQVFVLGLFMLVCTETEIYEVSGQLVKDFLLDPHNEWLLDPDGNPLYTYDNLVLKISNLAPGEMWTVADFQSYVLLNNGSQNVSRDTTTGKYSIVGSQIPRGSCIVGTEGQVLIGGAYSTETIFNLDKTGYTCFDATLVTTSYLSARLIQGTAIPAVNGLMGDSGDVLTSDAGDTILPDGGV